MQQNLNPYQEVFGANGTIKANFAFEILDAFVGGRPLPAPYNPLDPTRGQNLSDEQRIWTFFF